MMGEDGKMIRSRNYWNLTPILIQNGRIIGEVEEGLHYSNTTVRLLGGGRGEGRGEGPRGEGRKEGNTNGKAAAALHCGGG